MVLALKPRPGDDRAAVRAVQQFLGEGAWDGARILARREALVAQDLGAADGVLIAERSNPRARRAHRARRKPKFDREAYGQRHFIVNCVGRLKEARDIATRYEKLALHYLALVKVAMARRPLKCIITPLSHRD